MTRLAYFPLLRLRNRDIEFISEADIEKLQQILSLKQLGFSLEEIKETMENSNSNSIRVIKIQ